MNRTRKPSEAVNLRRKRKHKKENDNMYEIWNLKAKLRELNELVQRGEANQAIIDEIYEIKMRLDNIFYIYD